MATLCDDKNARKITAYGFSQHHSPECHGKVRQILPAAKLAFCSKTFQLSLVKRAKKYLKNYEEVNETKIKKFTIFNLIWLLFMKILCWSIPWFNYFWLWWGVGGCRVVGSLQTQVSSEFEAKYVCSSSPWIAQALNYNFKSWTLDISMGNGEEKRMKIFVSHENWFLCPTPCFIASISRMMQSLFYHIVSQHIFWCTAC